jgi:hypothetical protein
MIRVRWLYFRHNAFLIFAAIFPIIITLFDILDVANLPYYNFNAVSVTISVILIRISLNRFIEKDIVEASKGIVFDSLHNPVFVLNHGGEIINMNRKASKMQTNVRSELIGTPFTVTFPEFLDIEKYFSTSGENINQIMDIGGKT